MRRLVLAFATLCVVRGGARADDSSLHIIGLAQLGATDNLLSGPRSSTDPMAPPVEWDTYLGLRPGILATYGTPSAIHELTYNLDATLYVRHGSYSSLFHRAGWRGFFLIGPRSEVVTTVEGSFGDGNLFPTVAASSTQFGVQRSGDVETLGGGAAEDYSYQLDRDLRFTQGLTARYNRTSTSGAGVSKGSELGGRLGLDKSFRYDAMSLLVGGSYLTLERPSGTVVQSDSMLNARGSLMYRRDVSRFWTAIAEGGAVAVIPASGTGKTQVVPVAGFSLGYFPAWGTAMFSARRDVAPNLLIARNTVTDAGVVTCWLPLPWLKKDPTNPELSFESTIGYGRTRLIDTEMGSTVQGFDDFIADAAVHWNFEKNAGLTFRYQMIWQSSDIAMSTPAVYGFIRNTVLVQFFGRWPERLAVEVPIRNTLRVDRSNVTPMGEEVNNTTPNR